MFLKTSLFDEEFFHTSPVKHCKGRNIKKIHSLWPILKQCKPTWSASCVTSNTSDPLTKRPGARHYSVLCLPAHRTYPFILPHIHPAPRKASRPGVRCLQTCSTKPTFHFAWTASLQSDTHTIRLALWSLSLRMRKLETEGRIHFPIYIKGEGGGKHEEGERLITPNLLPNIKKEKLGWQVNKWLFIKIAIL